jgi:hypothetical protein
MYFVPMMWTSVNPAGGGSIGAGFAVSAVPARELLIVVVAGATGAVWTGAADVDTFSTGGLDDASVGVDGAIASIGDVDVAVEPVEVAATCARTGLTMVNPITSATTSALVPANTMMLVFISIVTY